MIYENEKIENLKLDHEKLIDFGFTKKMDCYIFISPLRNKDYFLKVVINKNNIEYSIYEKETNEKYVLFEVKKGYGEFVGTLRLEADEIIESIIKNCNIEESYKLKQTYQVIDYLKKKYNIVPEYLWENDNFSGALRLSENKKWIGIIMRVKASHFTNDEKGYFEVINLKNTQENVKKLVDNYHFFPGFHMNKKYWFTIILDGRVDNDIVFKLIDQSYFLINKN